MKERIAAFAKEKGFADVRFAFAKKLVKPLQKVLCKEAENIVYDPGEIFPDAKSIVVLYASYTPETESPDGYINVSEYYRVSNAAYHAAGAVAGYIVQNGSKAVLTTRLSAKQAALLTGGFIGRNGFYYHDTLGSCVCIHTILTDLDLGMQYEKTPDRCMDCEMCVKKCPVGAINQNGGVIIEKCLRMHLNGLVPEEMRKHAYQLFGCEKCQHVCPLNKKTGGMPSRYKMTELLGGEHMDELVLDVGKNMARRRRVESQTLLIAGAKKQKQLLPLVETYCGSAYDIVREHAIWARKQLMDEQ